MQDSIGPRSDMGTAAIESKLYLVGGTDGQQCLKSGCVIDLTTGESTEIAPMKSARSNFCLETIDGKLYAVGGWDGDRALDSVEQYNPQEDKWTTLDCMKYSRRDAKTARVGRYLCVVGGSNNSSDESDTESTSVQRSLEVYNIDTGKWSSVGEIGILPGQIDVIKCEGIIQDEVHVAVIANRPSSWDSPGSHLVNGHTWYWRYSFKTEEWSKLTTEEAKEDTIRSWRCRFYWERYKENHHLPIGLGGLLN